MAEVKRAVRVSARVREELATLLTTEVRDPRIQGVVVSRVQMSDDLRNARVFFRFLEGEASDEKKKDAMTGLARAAGMLRREVTQRVGLRAAPELRFTYDAGQEKVDRIEQLLDEVRREKK